MAKFNFISCHKKKNPDLYLLGVPYDGTSSYKPGSRFAPHSIRESSYGLETYCPILDDCLSEKKVRDLGDLELPMASASKVIRKIYRFFVKKVREKKIISIGGEHLISYPIVLSYLKYYPDLVLIHFDAHADFRTHFLGSRYSHATVIRLISSHIKKGHIYQFGIRSGGRVEWKDAYQQNHFYPYHLLELKEVVRSLSNKQPIYITIDLDVLDPSIFPGTGTPEPGGVQFVDLQNALLEFRFKNIIAADVVELSPNYDFSGVSSITAAKIIRQLILMMS